MNLHKVIFITPSFVNCGPNSQLYNIIYKLQNIVPHIVLIGMELSKKSQIFAHDTFNKNVKLIKLWETTNSNVKKLLLINSIIKCNKPDIVHIEGLKAQIIIPFILCKSKVVITQRNTIFIDYIKDKGFLLGCIMAIVNLYLLYTTKNVVSISLSVKRKLLKYGIKSHLIENGVNLDKYKLRFKVKNKTTTILIVGPLIKRKNIDVVLKTLSKYSEKESIKTLVVGSGLLEKYLRDKYEKFPYIIFVGETDNIQKFYQKADLLISYSLAEGLPNVVLEGLANNLPLLLSDIDEHKDIFRYHQSNPLIVKLVKLSEPENIITQLKFIDIKSYTDERNLMYVKKYYNAKHIHKKYYKYYTTVVNKF